MATAGLETDEKSMVMDSSPHAGSAGGGIGGGLDGNGGINGGGTNGGFGGAGRQEVITPGHTMAKQ